MKNRAVRFLIIFSILNSEFLFGLPPEKPQFELSIHLTIRSHNYNLKQTMSFEIAVQNHARHSIYIEDYLIPGSGGNIDLVIVDSLGKRVLPRDTMDAVLPFDTGGKLPVTQLRPKYFFGNTLTLPVAPLFLRPGKYVVFVEYRSKLSELSTSAQPVWDRSRPILKSNIVVLNIE